MLARVESAPLSELVTEMLQESDNIIADILARQVAVAEHVSRVVPRRHRRDPHRARPGSASKWAAG